MLLFIVFPLLLLIVFPLLLLIVFPLLLLIVFPLLLLIVFPLLLLIVFPLLLLIMFPLLLLIVFPLLLLIVFPLLLLIVFLLLLLSGGVDPPDTPVHPSPKNHSAIISKIATPILALSKDDIHVLMYMGNNLRNTLGHQGNLQLTPELQREFVDLTDSSEILKMFWIIKVAPPRLRNLTKSNWDL